jgi:hypothetical protein
VKYAGDGCEITSDNRPKNAIFDWFFDPLMVIKDQIKADNFTEEEEVYLQKRVLLISDPKRLKATLPHLPSLNERKQAEIDAFARRYICSPLSLFAKGLSHFFSDSFDPPIQDCKGSQSRY